MSLIQAAKDAVLKHNEHEAASLAIRTQRNRELQINRARAAVSRTLSTEYSEFEESAVEFDPHSPHPGDIDDVPRPYINLDGLKFRTGKATGGAGLYLVRICEDTGKPFETQINSLRELGEELDKPSLSPDALARRESTEAEELDFEELTATVRRLAKMSPDPLFLGLLYLAEISRENTETLAFIASKFNEPQYEASEDPNAANHRDAAFIREQFNKQ